MPNLRISEFTLNTTLNGSEIVLGVQSGNTVKISMDAIKTFVLDVDASSIGDVVIADVLLTDVNSTVLNIAVNSSTMYQIDAMLFIENPNTDGLIFDIGVYDLTTDIFNIGYVGGASFGVMEIAVQEVISDATGIPFIRMSGIISVTGTGGTMTVTARVDNNVIGTTSILKGSYIVATKIQ
jgi:hypothetical protein